MKKPASALALLAVAFAASASDAPYDETANAKAEVQQVLEAARTDHKQILLVFGAPQIPRVTLHLALGHTFTIEARNLSAANKYVQSIALNGQPCTGFKLAHADVVRGGRLVFEMGPQPKR